MIDLHTHTIYSDGADTPAEVLKKAADLGIRVLSITDHNSIGAYGDEAFLKEKENYAVKILYGIEVTCMFEGEVVEVLGYGYDPVLLKQLLPQHVLSFVDKQNKEKELIFRALDKSGAVYDPKLIHFDPSKESCRKAVWKELCLYPENDALFLNPSSKTSSRKFTRQEIYNPQSPLYVDEQSLYPTVQEAVEMIHQAGGIAFLAHLYEYANADELFDRMEQIVDEMKLDGLECRHNCFTPEDTKRLEEFCQNHRLYRSGGSDYHGSRKPNVVLGNVPEMQVPVDYIQQWPENILDMIQ